jgi:hypothetical protein
MASGELSLGDSATTWRASTATQPTPAAAAVADSTGGEEGGEADDAGQSRKVVAGGKSRRRRLKRGVVGLCTEVGAPLPQSSVRREFENPVLHHRSWPVFTRRIGLVEESHRSHPALVLRCEAGARLTPVVAAAKHRQKQPLRGWEPASPTPTAIRNGRQ